MSNRITSLMHTKHIIAVCIILMVTLLFFWPVIIGGNWHVPYGGGDLESFTWPTYSFTAETIKSGKLPLWNPYLHSGAPHAADNQSGLFYPLNILLSILPNVSYRAMEWLVVIHVFLAGLGMYYASYYHNKSKSINPPLVAAIAFQFSSLFVTHIGNLNIIASASYLPWAWLATEHLYRSQTYKAATLISIPLTLSILAGHAQISLIILITILTYSIYILTVTRTKTKFLMLIIYAAVLTAGLTSFYTLPSIEMSLYTNRINFNYEDSSKYSIPLEGLIGIITPLLYGRGSEYFWPGWDRVELGFMGLITLTLSCLGLIHKQNRMPFIVLVFIGLFISIGNATPIHKFLYTNLPGFSLFRVPARFILITNFSMAMLASSGLSYWQSSRFNHKHLLYSISLVTIAIITLIPLAWQITSNKYTGSSINHLTTSMIVALVTIAILYITKHRFIVIIIAIEMIALGSWIEVDYTSPEFGYKSGPALEYLKDQPEPFRIDIASSEWQPNYGLMHKIESINGLHNPMTLSDYDTYYWSVNYRGSPQYNFLNAKYLITDKNQPAADSTFIPIYDKDPRVDVYLNTNSLPRITLIYNTTNVTNSSQAFTELHKNNFNPKTEVILIGGKTLSSDPPSVSNLNYENYTDSSYTINVSSPIDAYLVSSEVWYPGWFTTIDNIPTETLKANYAFKAIYIPAGDHIVHSEYSPTLWKYSLSISIICTMLLLATLLLPLQNSPYNSNED